MPTEKDPKEHFIEAFRTPKTRNGNTTRLLVVYELTNGVRVVHACELSGDVGASLEEWTSNGRARAAEWSGRVGEVNEISAKEAKAYLERSRKLALRAIDQATKSVTFDVDTESVGPVVRRMKFAKGERISVTDVVTHVMGQPATIVSFTYRGGTCMVRAADVTVSP